MGGAILVSPPPATEMTADSCTASAIVSANTVISAPLALPARTRYNTCGLERPPLWPVLACRPMAGFEVSTEASTSTWRGWTIGCGTRSRSYPRGLSSRRSKRYGAASTLSRCHTVRISAGVLPRFWDLFGCITSCFCQVGPSERVSPCRLSEIRIQCTVSSERCGPTGISGSPCQ